MGAPINARMGLNTWAAFVGTDDNAAIAGDVAMLANEVHAGAQGAAQERARRRRDPPSHDRHAADDLLPALLGHRPGRETGDRLQGGVERNGKAEGPRQPSNSRRGVERELGDARSSWCRGHDAPICGGNFRIRLVSSAAATPLTLVRTIDLPASKDASITWRSTRPRNDSIVAALGNNTVEVLDLKAGHTPRACLAFESRKGLPSFPTRSSSPLPTARVKGCSSSTRATSIRPGRFGWETIPTTSATMRLLKRLFVGFGSGRWQRSIQPTVRCLAK